MALYLLTDGSWRRGSWSAGGVVPGVPEAWFLGSLEAVLVGSLEAVLVVGWRPNMALMALMSLV